MAIGSHSFLSIRLPNLQLQPNFLSCISLIPSRTTRNSRIDCCLTYDGRTDQVTNAPTHGGNVDSLRVAFAAGGIGGRIYPAVAIADELKTINPSTQILFIGNPASMESTAISSAGYLFTSVPAAPIDPSMLSFHNLFVLPLLLTKSFIESWRKLKDFDPHIVIGTGGSVSFPICFAAILRGIKVVIQEQNSVPGVSNWVLSFLADKVFVAYDSTVECFPSGKSLVCGNPVRLSLRNYVSKVVARRHFFPRAGDMGAKVVLVLGGSVGANAVNVALLNFYCQMLAERENLYIIWQTGVEAFDEMESLVKTHPRLSLTPFLHSMELAYAAADLVVSRAGAMTCYEILATGKPSILIPSPDDDEGHQLRNASLMADLAGSRVITEDELDCTILHAGIEEILDDEKLIIAMSERALRAAKSDASAEIARHILSLVSASMK